MNKFTIINWKRFLEKKRLYFLISFALFCLFLAILTIFLILYYPQKKEPVLGSFSDEMTAVMEKTEKEVNITLTTIVVDIGGAVKNTGVYQLAEGSRLADLIRSAGGFKEEEANKLWLQRNLNLAEKLADGKKYYIPYLEETVIGNLAISNDEEKQSVQENTGKLISINQATLKTLTTLPSIGDIRGQAIIDNRPYEKVEDLLTNEIVTETLFEKIKNLISL